MVNKTTKKLIILAGLAVLALALLFLCRTPRPTEEGRYADLHRCGRAFERIRNGKVSVREWVEARLHLANPSDYYRGRMEAEAGALLGSGYFVRTTVPVTDLRTEVAWQLTNLENTGRLFSAYYEAKFNWPSNEVLLVCRRRDVPLLIKSLEKAPPQ